MRNRLYRFAWAIAGALAIVFGTSACADDGRVCVHSHSEQYVYYVTVGKILIPEIGTYEECDTWQQRATPSPSH